MGTMVKYVPGVNDEAIVELCEALEAAYERAEAHVRAHTARRKGREEWAEYQELRRAALNHAGQP